jgi:hypothetical protein
MDAEVSRGHVGAKLSFVRIGFNYFTSEAVADYVIEAMHLVADEGWRLLPRYRFDPLSGLWEHERLRWTPLVSLDEVWSSGGGSGPDRTVEDSEEALPVYLAEARRVLQEAVPSAPAFPDPVTSPEFERIRWFPLPSEAAGSRGAQAGAHPARVISRG